MKVEGGPYFVELLQKTIVSGDALAIGIEHDKADIAGLSGADEVDDSGMDGRLAPGKLDNLGPTLGPDVVIEHLLDFFERQAETWCSIGKAKRTIHIAGTVDIDNGEAGVLLMIGA